MTLKQTERVFGLIALLTAGLLHAQSNATDAAIEGYIKDASGGSVAGAKITVQDVGTKFVSGTKSNTEGYYRFPLLRVGTYGLDISAQGFREFTESGIVLEVGKNVRLDAKLEVGDLSEKVTVTADLALDLADTGTAATGDILTHKEVEDLPVLSRNIYNYHLLSPGVQGLTSATFGTTQFTFGGNERSSWSLDGLDNTQRGGNRQIRMVITTPEAVEEMQVLANGYSAEFGRAAGGQVNVVLKSGANSLHGSGLFYYRAKDMQARPSLAAVNPDRTWNDAAFTLGGPIKRDRVFFFGQFENNPYTLPNPVTITPANAAALNLPAHDIGNAPFGETYRTIVAKVDFRLNDRNTGYVRYNRFTNHQPGNASGLTITDRGNNFNDHMNGGGVQLATVISSELLNEVRGGVIRRTQANAPIGPPVPDGSYINITGVANIGFDPLAATQTTEQSDQLLDNLTWTHGRNTVKAGVDYQHTEFNIFKAENRSFTFGGLAALNGRPAVSALNQYLNTLQGLTDPATGLPYTYTLVQWDGGNPNLNIGFNFLNAFVQDEFRLSPAITLNFGLRYEAILFPELDPNAPYPLSRRINNDLKDFAPRVALNWRITNDGKTVLRAAYGLFYDVPPLSIFYTAAQVNGDRFLSYQIAGGAPGAPVFPNIPSAGLSSQIVAPSINAFAPGYRNTHQGQANLQIQRELGWHTVMTVGYNLAEERHGIYSENINLGAPTGTLADGRPIYGGLRPNPAFNQINLIESGGNTSYNGMFVNLKKSLSQGLLVNVTWTWSHALANTLGEGGSPEDPSNLQRDYGNADDNVGQYLVGQALYEPHFKSRQLHFINGFELSSTMFYNSGYPINITSGIDLNKDGNLNDRPLFTGRNSVTGPSILQVDARLQRMFLVRERLRLIASFEAENLLNSTNANCSTSGGCTGAVVSTAGALDFSRVTSARTARNVQFGIKVTF
jgi:Carboxypeptidase regulatory-like domain